MPGSAFDEPFFTLTMFTASAHDLFAQLADLQAAFTQRRISRPFTEKIGGE